jgi:arginyl-tRNA synthetase
MSIVSKIKEYTSLIINNLYQTHFAFDKVIVNATKPGFEGDYTVVLFEFSKQLKKTPMELGEKLGEKLVTDHPTIFLSYNLIQGFLNITISDIYWLTFIEAEYDNKKFGHSPKNDQKIMVEYSSPNTNKPLHLGHLRNNFLGKSIADILEMNGNSIAKTCIVNDRGIHICKSMLAWRLFANGRTPASTKKKGDHFVGDYYVKFNTIQKRHIRIIGLFAYQVYRKHRSKVDGDDLQFISSVLTKAKNEFAHLFDQLETGIIKAHSNYHKYTYTDKYVEYFSSSPTIDELEPSPILNFEKEMLEIAFKKNIRSEKRFLILAKHFEKETPIMKEAQKMLLDWEAGKPEVLSLWEKMNSWVYKGFDITYKRIGSHFDKIYYESETYLLGKHLITMGLEKNVFVQKSDGSVWIDLSKENLDEKLVRRKDGTSVYITQDIGLAEQKQKEFNADQSIYVVGDEQNYHFKVLKLICQKLGLPSADGIYHLSYGMVELPTGKMKSREGTVVDADDLVDEMVEIARKKTEELGKVKDFTKEELKELYDIIGLGALKFFLLRVDPKKRMVFNPEESIDFHGFTGPFIQYSHARIKSILRKAETIDTYKSNNPQPSILFPLEKELSKHLEMFPSVLQEAGNDHDPSKVAVYIYNLAKIFNSLYAEHTIAKEKNKEKKRLRLQLSQLTAQVIKDGTKVLGIRVPERM